MADRPDLPGRPQRPMYDLAVAALRGDRAAFDQIHARFGEGVLRFFLKRTRGQGDRAEELAHKTWIAVWRALTEQRFDPERAAISTFVYGVSYKIWLQELRALGNAHASIDNIDAFANDVWTAADENPVEFLRMCETLDDLRACLAAHGTPHSLTPEERDVVVGIAGGEPERTVAERLNIAASTVNARKKSAYAKLLRCMSAKGH